MSWQMYALLTILAWGTTPLIDKVGLRTIAPDTGVCIRAFTAAIIMGIYGLARGKFGEITQADPKGLLCLVGGGILVAVVAQITYFAALRQVDVSKIVPFTATYPLVAVVLGILLLDESLTAQKLIGTALIVGGLMLLGTK